MAWHKFKVCAVEAWVFPASMKPNRLFNWTELVTIYPVNTQCYGAYNKTRHLSGISWRALICAIIEAMRTCNTRCEERPTVARRGSRSLPFLDSLVPPPKCIGIRTASTGFRQAQHNTTQQRHCQSVCFVRAVTEVDLFPPKLLRLWGRFRSRAARFDQYSI